MCLCPECGASFDGIRALQSHKSAIHDTRLMSCNECDLQLKGLKSLKNHMKSHQKKMCNNCGSDFPVNSLSKHKRKCLQLPSVTVTNCCDFENCTYESNRKDNLRIHKKSHEEKIKFINMCIICEKSFEMKKTSQTT